MLPNVLKTKPKAKMEHCLKLSVFVSTISLVNAFFIGGPCDIYARPDHSWQPATKEQEIEARVPDGCQNGTVNWSYPRGHLLLYVSNVNATPTSICVKDWGSTFNFTNVSEGRQSPLTKINEDSFQCTTQTTAIEIVLNVREPTMLLYVGGFQYLVKQSD